MNSLKTLCVAVVLSAVGYGAYVTLTGKPMNEPPPDAAGFDSLGPEVQMPEVLGVGTPPPAQTAASTPAAAPGNAAPPAALVPDTGAAPPFASTGTPPTATPPAEASTTPPFITPPVGPPGTQTTLPGTTAGAASLSTTTAPGATTSAGLPAAPPAWPSTSAGTSPAAAADGPQATLTPAGIDTSAAPQNDPHAEYASAVAAAQAMLSQNRLADAELALSEWYDSPRLVASDEQQLRELLDQLAGTVVYSRQHLLEQPYIVQPGDNLERVAERYNVPWQLLAKINGVADPRYLRPGEELKVVRGPFDAVVNLQKFELTLFLRGRYAGRFRIGIGQDQATPTGEFTVINKVANPVYQNGSQTIAADDPTNPLGERWIDLGNHIGIHGTNDPQSIGRAESRGCIRLTATDVEDVYDILSVGSKVVIRR